MSTPEQPIEYVADTFYTVTAQCTNSTCDQYDKVLPVDFVYSNSNALCIVVCGQCGNTDTILTATAMDPQPVES